VVQSPPGACALTQSRIRGEGEGHDEGQDYTRSVVSGLVTSAVVITAAASIMVFVFGGFVLNGDPTVKQFGIGLAVAVILDSTVVRCLLVPARMVMLGKRTWYLPRWLGRILPHISIEGAEYFKARDQLPAASQAPDPASGPAPLVSAKDS
jgi:putative drug exporter of the RND superfamily